MFTDFLKPFPSINYGHQYRCFYGRPTYLLSFSRNKQCFRSYFYCRGSRLHKGYDIVCSVGASVDAPFPASVKGVAIPYSQRTSHWGAAYNTGVFLEGTGSWAGRNFISNSFVQKAKMQKYLRYAV